MKLRWSHAVIYVRDLEAMIAFYREVLGFEVSDRGPLAPGADIEVAFLSQVGSDHHQLAFAAVRGDGPSTTLDHMAFRVESFADVQAMAKKLEKDGRAAEIHGLNHGNAWSVYFKDPEGNGLEVFCDSPFGVQQPQVRPLELSMSEEELFAHTVKEFGDEPGFMPADEFFAAHRKRLDDEG